MKYTKYLIYLFAFTLFASCGSDYDANEEYTLTDLPGYVAFDAVGNSAFLDDVAIAEDGGSTSLNIECPTGTLSDITVNYSFGGDAVFGVDFNVAGATASGGTIVLVHRPSDVPNRDNVDLNIDILTDGDTDGTKTLTVTLVSASNAEGTMAVGRGGTDFLKTANIVIADID